MINLLPPAKKEDLQKEENFRLVLILGVLWVFFLVCFSLLLLAIRIYVAGEIQTQNILVEAGSLQQEESALQNIRALNRDVGGLAAFYENQVMLSRVIADISSAAPSGIYLTSFNYAVPSQQGAKNNTPAARISVTGFAPTTEDLLAFRTNLEQQNSFANVNIPPANWVNSQNITFSFDFEFQPITP